MTAVLTETRGRTFIITLDRPTKRNALNGEVTAGLDAALNELDDNPDVWCGVLTGGPDFFSAGADLAEGPGEPTPRGGIVGIITRERVKPLIAAVEGFALGGGMELVLCCDLVVAATNARFGLPEVKRGLMPDFGGAFRVVRSLPPNVGREMLLTARDLTADRAERLGLVNELVEPGGALDAAVELAATICENSPLGARAALRVANAAVRGDESALWAISNDGHAGLLATEDLVEGVNAFFERRLPTWHAR